MARVRAGVHDGPLSVGAGPRRGRSPAWRRSLGLAIRRVHQVEERRSTVSVGAEAQIVRGVLGEHLALPHQQQAVAALGLVHDVRGDEDGAAFVGEPVEELHRSRRRTGSRPTVGSSSTSSSGSPSRATARETGLRWPPERRPASSSACGPRSTSVMARSTWSGGSRCGRARRRSSRGSGGGQIGVDGRRLGDVADAGRSARSPAGPSTEGAGDLGLRADDGAHQGGLAAAGGAEEAGDAAAGRLERHGVRGPAARRPRTTRNRSSTIAGALFIM